MNTGRHATKTDTPRLSASLQTLWEEARGWVAWLAGLFDPAALRTHGVSRREGARLGLWLRDIESSVRRLILSAALMLALPVSRRTANHTTPRTRLPPTATRRPAFHIFRLGGSGLPTRTRAAPTTMTPPRTYGHVVFARDPLLTLGATPQRTSRGAHSAGPPNPLDRWARLSRQDPDWHPPEEKHDASRSTSDDTRSTSRPHWDRGPPVPETLPASLWDWRRRHDEWRKPVAAPALAARLEALQRVAENPEAAIAGAARRLRAYSQAFNLARCAAPRSRTPRRAAHILTAGHTTGLAERCHDALSNPDTS